MAATWKRLIDAQSAARYLMLGPSSRGLTDVDLDSAEAITAAPYLLPRTSAIFGGASKRASHRMYYSDLSAEQDSATIQFRAPVQRMLLELRIGGDKGAQTVFPESTHESGEEIAWEELGEPADVDDSVLLTSVKHVAAAALIARSWPPQGGRHGAALAFCSVKPVRPRKPPSRAAADPEWRDRVKAAQDAAREHKAGGRAYGFPTLVEIIGEPSAKRVAECPRNWACC